jgi:hypothetical protein
MNEVFRRLNESTQLGHVPMPASLPLFDERYQTVNLPVFVVGPTAPRFLMSVAASTNPAGAAAQRIVSFALPGQAAWSLLPVLLGDIRGWAPILYLYGISADSRLTTTLRIHGRYARGFIIATDAGFPTQLSRVLAELCARNASIPCVVFGSSAVAEQLSPFVPRQPLCSLEPNETNAMTALKQLVQPILHAVLHIGTA